MESKSMEPNEDSPELAEADFARGKRMRDVMPEVMETMKRGRGRPKLTHAKVRVSLRLDPEIVAAYKATGEGWRSRIDEALAIDLARRNASKA